MPKANTMKLHLPFEINKFCLSKINMISVLFFLFEWFCNLTFMWPLTPQLWVTRRVYRVHFWCLTKINTLTVLLLSFEVVSDLTFLTFDLLSVGRMKRSLWTVLMFDQDKHIDSVTFIISCCLRFDLFWPLTP